MTMTCRRRLAATAMTALLLIPPTSSSATSTARRHHHDHDRQRRRQRHPRQQQQQQQSRRKTIDVIGAEQARQDGIGDPNDMFLFLTTEAPLSDDVATTTTATAAAATLANGDVIVNPGGTCGAGKGDRGNGICANGKCCSKHGWCGTTPAHCDGTTFEPTSAPSGSPIISAPPTTLPPTTKAPTAPPDPTVSPTTSTPTLPPTVRLFSAHTKFCGPKVVGGFQYAVERCSVATECGTGEGSSTAYGASGNDCPPNFMCFADIECLQPTYVPSVAPSAVPSTTLPSVGPTESYAPSEKGQTRPPTSEPTESNAPTEYPTEPRPPTRPPFNLVNSITTRGSFCGATFEEAVSGCSPTRACDNDDNCEDKVCFPNISCTFHASKASDENYLLSTGGGDGSSQQEEEEEGDDVYETEFDTDDARFGEEYIPDDISGTAARRLCGLRAVMAVSFLGALLIT